MTSHRLLAFTVATLVGCGSSKPAPVTEPVQPPPPVDPVTPSADPPQEAPPPPAAATGPEIGAWGFDTKGMDTTVKPGASFYQFANGGWLRTTEIPADKSNYGMFSVLTDRSDERTREIILAAKGAPGSEERKVADLYASFLDEAGIEKKGLAPAQAQLAAIAAITDTRGVVAMFATHGRLFAGSPFLTFVDQDEREPEKHIAFLAQSGLGLPDRDMYDAKAKQFEKLRAGYLKFVTDMFTLAKLPDAGKRAAAVYALEEKIAKVHWTRTQNRDPQKTYNKLTPAALAKLAPGIDWKVWLEGTGLAAQPAINVNQPTAVAGVAKLVQSEPLAVWKDYLTIRWLQEVAPYLPKAFVDTHFEMYGKTLSGTPQLRDRWKRGVDQVTGALGEAVGKLYVTKYFTPATKASMDELVANLLVAMGQRLDALTWMSPATKAKAKEKLATYAPQIGYPAKWRDYGKLEVVRGDALGNAIRAQAFEYDRRIAKLGQPVDRGEWGMTPMTVNASYNPVLNAITFPAAILQPPFFDAKADPAINYGGIGAVIGHEISHGFDDQGAQYDAKGALKNWWTKADEAKFKAATKQLVAQYDKYCPFKGRCVKGAMTLGENIADLAGLTVAYQAYQLSLKGQPAPVLDGMTGDQRFFLGWAQVWRRLYRDAEMEARLVTDVHSPSEFRSAVVRNLDVWYEAFKPAPNDALYLAPAKRVRIW